MMDFLKMNKFRKARKSKPVNEPEEVKPVAEPVELNGDHVDDSNANAEDDFIINEMRKKIQEMKMNKYMDLIPEEDEFEVEIQVVGPARDPIYDTYCERMLFYDRLIAQQLPQLGENFLIQNKYCFLCFSLPINVETEQLEKPMNNPYRDLETAYTAQLCLTWEALRYQYTQLSQKILSEPESSTEYNHTAQQFQHLQVLLQRFIENEPFDEGSRPEIYARVRTSFPKLLQVPEVQGSDKQRINEEEPELVVLAQELIKIIEGSILTFRLFLNMDKRKNGAARKLFGFQYQMETPLYQLQSSLVKKTLKLKDLRKKKRSFKDKWPATEEDVELLFGLIDAKVLSRVLRMREITANQLLWCEEMIKRLDFSHGKLQRDPSPIMFPV